jgi:hypothetical protein
MAEDWSVSGVDRLCHEIAAAAAETAVGTMLNMCGNAGQASIISSAAGGVEAQIDDIANGNASSIDADHKDAVGIILQAGEDILQDAAQRCATIREAAVGHD